jgi:hypothetical protein
METTFQFLKDVRENVSNDAERRLVDIGVSRTIASFDEAKAMFMLLGLTRTLKVNTLLAEELFVTMTDHHDTRFLMYKTKGGTYRVLSELPVVAGAAVIPQCPPQQILQMYTRFLHRSQRAYDPPRMVALRPFWFLNSFQKIKAKPRNCLKKLQLLQLIMAQT